MEKEIVNRVANSKLVSFDLEELYPNGQRLQFDISPWLLEGIVLREKEFRQYVKNHDWAQYQNTYVALYCTTDAIVPAWAYMLIATKLAQFAIKTVTGTLENLETAIYAELIENLNLEPYKDKAVIVKGCSHLPVPASAYVHICAKLQPVVKSIMYGEACSSVPLYKKSK